MGQTAVDLPDPMKSSGGGGFQNADDLLAQLAGEEVDRLLNEADDAPPAPLNVDLAPPPAKAVTKSAQATPPNPVVDATEAALDDLFDQLNSAEIPGVAKPPPAAAAAVDPTQAGLDDLFEQLTANDPPAQSAAAPAATPPVAKDATGAPAASVSPPVVKTDVATQADLDALFEQLTVNDPAPAAAAVPVDKPVDQVIAERANDLAAQAQRAAAGSVGEASAADALAAEMAEDEATHAAAMRRLGKSAAAVADEELKAQEAALIAAAAAAEVAEPAAVGIEIDEQAIELDPEPDADEQAGTDADAAEIDAAAVDVDERLPLLVRVLEWMNAPLSGLSDTVREALGKIAIVTSVNAVAVLTYVLLFRRH
jgi:hypothetical protein